MAYFWIISSSFAFTVLGAFVKAMPHLPVYEVAFFRSLVNLLWLLPWQFHPAYRVHLGGGWKREYKLVLLRGVSGTIAMLLYFFAITHLRLADAYMLNYSSPIPTIILSYFFLGERLPLKNLIFVGVALLGVGFVLKPGFGITGVGGVAGVVGAFFSGVAYTSMKAATRSLPSHFIVFTFALVAVVMTAVPMAVQFTPPTPHEWLLLLGAGTTATFAQQAMTLGYTGLPASIASPLQLTVVIFSTALGWLFWSEIPDHWSVLGGVLLILGLVGANKKWRVRR